MKYNLAHNLASEGRQHQVSIYEWSSWTDGLFESLQECLPVPTRTFDLPINNHARIQISDLAWISHLRLYAPCFSPP